MEFISAILFFGFLIFFIYCVFSGGNGFEMRKSNGKNSSSKRRLREVAPMEQAQKTKVQIQKTPPITTVISQSAPPDRPVEKKRDLPSPLEQPPPAIKAQVNANAEIGIASKLPKRNEKRNQKLKAEVPQVATPAVDHFFEGAVQQITLTKYERDPRARRACLAHHGTRCAVCDTDFRKRFGELGERVIQVHHLRPLSEISERHKVNPITDMIPVCPTCHVMLHQEKPPILPEILRQYLIAQGQIKTPFETTEIKKRKSQPSKVSTPKQIDSATAKKPKVKLLEKLPMEQLEFGAKVSYDDRVPSDRLPNMIKAVKSLIAAGVTSPELVADTLDRINPRSRKFSEHFWELFCEADPSLCRSVDWQAVYEAKDANSRTDQS